MEPQNSQNTLKAGNLGNRPGSPERCGLLGPQCLVLPRISRMSRFGLPSYDSGVFALSPVGRLSPFLRQTCLFLFFCESQDIDHQYITIFTFLRGAILSWPAPAALDETQNREAAGTRPESERRFPTGFA